MSKADINIVIGAQDKATKVINGMAGKLTSLAGPLAALGPVAIGIGAAVAVAGAAFVALNSAIDAVNESRARLDLLAKSAKGLGESATDLRSFQMAIGEFSGASAEQATDALRKMQKAIGDAVGGTNADVFEKLGLDAKALSLQEPVDQFKAIQRAIQGVGTASERAAIGEFTGAGPEQAADALRKMQKAIGGTNIDVFEKLGLDAAALSLQEPVDQFKAIQRAIQGVGTSSEQAAISQKLMGEGAAKLAPALLANADAFQASIDAANSLNANLDGGGAEAIEAMNDALGRVETGMQGVIDQATVALSPAITAVAEVLATWLPPVIKLAQYAMPLLVTDITFAIGYAKDLAGVLGKLAVLDFSGAVAGFETIGETGDEMVEALNKSRDAAIKAAEQADKTRMANAASAVVLADDVKQAEKKANEIEKTFDALEKQLAIAQMGSDEYEKQQQLATARNDTERERIALMQRQVTEQEQINTLAEQQSKAENDRINKSLDANEKVRQDRLADEEAKQQALANAPRGTTAVESRLLSRGPSDMIPKQSLEVQKKTLAVLDRIEGQGSDDASLNKLELEFVA